MIALEVEVDPKKVTQTGQLPPEDQDAVASAESVRSLLIIRFAGGAIGVLLPIILIVVDFKLLGSGCVRVRDSLSAYYHSGARDIFVIGLGAVGFLLIFYKITRGSPANYLSSVAGMAAVAVAVIPTRLPEPLAANECGGDAAQPVLTPLQNALTEDTAGAAHMVSAFIVFAMFAAMCFNTAIHDKRHPMARPADATTGPRFLQSLRSVLAWISNKISWGFHAACGGVIVAGGVFYGLAKYFDWGLPLHFGPLWVAEVLAILMFSASWFAKGLDDMFWRREPWSRDVAFDVRTQVTNLQNPIPNDAGSP
ncbi:hypothetical protein [Nocardia fluminea]|uniref:hypothetical protein n=1 Tax=Nocardia fluminea TaxID=134984 RepID=UPI00365BE247